MPGGSGRPRRACRLCKWYKYWGNNVGRFTERETATRKNLDDEMVYEPDDPLDP